jgi:hypothetical protein
VGDVEHVMAEETQPSSAMGSHPALGWRDDRGGCTYELREDPGLVTQMETAIDGL